MKLRFKFLSCFGLLAFIVAPATAATITVNSLADVSSGNDGLCTLREAIIAADVNTATGNPGECTAGEPEPVVDQIGFEAGLTGTIALSSSLPAIGESVHVIGPGMDSLTIDATAAGGTILNVFAPSTIEGLNFEGGDGAGNGGAIGNTQPLTVLNCRFLSNRAAGGGAINARHDLTVERSVFLNNLADQFDGGAIRLASSDKRLVVRDSLFEGNQTTIDGGAGGAINVGGSDHITEITGSTFVSNAANGANREGGAIRIGGASLAITNSTFSGNSAAGNGGAISFRAQEHSLANVTVTGNSADSDGDGSGNGGGLWKGSSLPATIRNSLIAGNIDSGDEAPDCSGSFTSGGYNLIGDGTGCSGIADGVNGDQVGSATSPIDPLLAALADDGGPTPTLALLPSSPAIDAGNPAGCTDAADDPLAVDQRGSARPTDGDGDGTALCDIGAFELAAENIFADRFQAIP